MHPTPASPRPVTAAGPVAVLVSLLVLAGLVAPPAARAATIDVTTQVDELNEDGDCSLREAIVAANTNTAVDGCTAGDSGVVDVINVPADIYNLTIEGPDEDQAVTGDLDVTEGVRIQGAGRNATIIDAGGQNQGQFCEDVVGPGGPGGLDAGSSETLGGEDSEMGIDRVFHASIPPQPTAARLGVAPRTLEMRGVEVRGGTATDQESDSVGGGGILTEGFDLDLTNVDVVDNLGAGDFAGFGGGISADSAVDLDGTDLTDNIALGGLFAAGGGLFNGASSGGSAAVAGDISDRARARRAVRSFGDSPTNPLTVVNSRLDENHACASYVASGGGASVFNLQGSFEETDFSGNMVLARLVALGGGLDAGGLITFFGGAPQEASLDIVGGSFEENDVVFFDAGSDGPPPPSGGGGIANGFAMTLRRVLVDDNTVLAPVGTNPEEDRLVGGGIFHIEGSLNVRRSLIRDNATNPPDLAAGGVSAAGRPLPVGFGGGVYAWVPASFSNSTFSGNEADAGGGVAYVPRDRSEEDPPPGPLRLGHVTVSDNSAPTGGGVLDDESAESGDVLLDSSIIALQATGPDCEYVGSGDGDGFASVGYNMDSDDTCDLDAPSDEPNRDPKLSALPDTGTSNDVHRLLAGSPAIDAVVVSACPPPSIDQRGVSRPQDGDEDGVALCDMGAAERKVKREVEPKFCPGFAGDPRNQVVGGPAAETLVGTARRDVICGLGGSDTLRGLAANDVILGGRGRDTLRGNRGADRMDGGTHRDVLAGGFGSDKMRGKNGPDSLFGQAGNDRMRSGAGPDTQSGGPGADRIWSFRGDDFLHGNGGPDLLFGSEHDDVLHGDRGNDEVRGFTGDDRVFGEAGNDLLTGWRGNDHLDGGPHKDDCRPGPGTDTTVRCEDGG